MNSNPDDPDNGLSEGDGEEWRDPDPASREWKQSREQLKRSFGPEDSWAALRQQILKDYAHSPRYTGLTFSSVQRLMKAMTGSQPQTWEDLSTPLYAALGVRTILLDDMRLQIKNYGVGKHYLTGHGWHNFDAIECYLNDHQGFNPDFPSRIPSFFRVYRKDEHLIELGVSYELPDLNEKGYQEQVGVTLRRSSDEDPGIHRLVSCSVSEYRPYSDGSLILTHGGQDCVGFDRDTYRWREPRYAQALEEVFTLLQVQRDQVQPRHPDSGKLLGLLGLLGMINEEK